MQDTIFHPAVELWFSGTFAHATDVQRQAWPVIAAGRNTLIAAPTGSGKTLAAFLAVIDRLVRVSQTTTLLDETQIVYVSPLKALSNDIRRNLEWPLNGINAVLATRGAAPAPIRVSVRTGDTSAAARQAMLRQPPHILVTTPESLYLLLTSDSGRKMLRTTCTVIIDEIHAVATSKRGSHLALSLQRLEGLAGEQIQRIGLSATQKPIDSIAKFLTGENRECTIIDTGHVRDRDLALELPPTPLEAVMSGEVWGTVYDRLSSLIETHCSTLVFVNTRRTAERVAFHLSERLGKSNVAAHHGSLSKETRLQAEDRLKAGDLKVLVATASLELGIDIGDVDLVCQLGSPRAISTFLQRIGRSGHGPSGLPKGRLFPLSRDDLVECTALIDSVNRGELDCLRIPEKPLDILAQQIVAEVACGEWTEADLFKLLSSAWSYRDLTQEEFFSVVRVLSDGFALRRGRCGAYLHRDAVNGRLRARKGARLTALTSGGAIPDIADYSVVLEPSGLVVGTLNEDFAIESMAGDIFQLGNLSYRILRVEKGQVRVEDAKGAPPSIPFWFGEAPGRSDELSNAVARLRAEVNEYIGSGSQQELNNASQRLVTKLGLSSVAAEQLVDYLAAAKAMLGQLPTQDQVVIERFFDETGNQQLVIHAPFGSRINRAWGLALRKRFCRQFNFELQAAATDDAIIFSLGETHSFQLADVSRYLRSQTVHDILVQALLAAPLFGVRWRWVTTMALAIPRFRGGRKYPAPLQRIEAEDLMSVVFPDCLACLENVQGDREIPDHPLVTQVLRDCLEDAMDEAGLITVVNRLEAGSLRCIAKDLPQPSPLAQEILNARPYAFLDDAPLEERRTQAVANRRWLDPQQAREFGQLDTAAIARVRREIWPDADNADELHDVLLQLVVMSDAEIRQSNWDDYLLELVRFGRATRICFHGQSVFWVATERVPVAHAAFPAATIEPKVPVPEEFRATTWTSDASVVEILRGRLQASGPVTIETLVEQLALPETRIAQGLAVLEAEGVVMRGSFTPGNVDEEFCERRLLARIHRYTIERLRAEIEPASTADFIRFLLDWHSIATDPRPEGSNALQRAIELLEGFEAPAVAWERDLLPSRLSGYDPGWLDGLCSSGRVVWTRLTTPRIQQGRSPAPVRTTPVALLSRRAAGWWRDQARQEESEDQSCSASATQVRQYLARHGASFFDEIVDGSGLLRAQVESAIAELVSIGEVSSDSFAGLRWLLTPASKRRHRHPRRVGPASLEQAGRWALVRGQPGQTHGDSDDGNSTERVARHLLRRYGVVCKRLLSREAQWLPTWYELIKVFRRLEATGEIRGGRFVAGVSGEQFALPDAVARLRSIRRQPHTGQLVSLSAADPLNLIGILTPGPRLPATASNRILFRDGVPVALLCGKETQILEPVSPDVEWRFLNALVRAPVAAGSHLYIN